MSLSSHVHASWVLARMFIVVTVFSVFRLVCLGKSLFRKVCSRYAMIAGSTAASAKSRRGSVIGSTDLSPSPSSKSYTSQQSSQKSGDSDSTEARTKPNGLPSGPTAIKAHRRSVN